MKLILKSKIKNVDTDKVVAYKFDLVNEKSGEIREVRIPCEEAIKKVKECDVKKRNCRIYGKSIGLKEGNEYLDTEYDKGKGIIKLFTRIEDFNKFENRIYYNDAVFARLATEDINFIEKNEKVMNIIDKAKIVNNITYQIRTPFGITSLQSLSTGCKTLLNIMYVLDKSDKEYIVNLNECGDNVIELIFKLTRGKKISFYLCYSAESVNTDKYVFIINGKEIRHDIEFINEVEKVLESEHK